MPSQFTRPTLIAAAPVLQRRMNNNEFDHYVLELGCENPQTTTGTLPTKINGLLRYAFARNKIENNLHQKSGFGRSETFPGRGVIGSRLV